MKLVGCKSALNPPVVYSTDRSKKGGGPDVSLTLCCFVVYSTMRNVLSLALCYFVLVCFSPLSTAITSLGEERANLSVFRTYVDLRLFGFVCFLFLFVSGKGCGMIVALPGLFSYLFVIPECTFIPTIISVAFINYSS